MNGDQQTRTQELRILIPAEAELPPAALTFRLGEVDTPAGVEARVHVAYLHVPAHDIAPEQTTDDFATV